MAMKFAEQERTKRGGGRSEWRVTHTVLTHETGVCIPVETKCQRFFSQTLPELYRSCTPRQKVQGGKMEGLKCWTQTPKLTLRVWIRHEWINTEQCDDSG